MLTAITTRFPPAHVVVAETFVQGPRAAPCDRRPRSPSSATRGADVVIVARGGGSFEDLLPFSDERLVRAVAACPVPVVSAVGHEQDTPLVDLAADVRASTPSVAGRLVVPDLAELAGVARAARTRASSGARGAIVERHAAERLAATHERLGRAPLLALERRGARLEADSRPPAGALAARDARARLRDRPRRRGARPRAARRRARSSRSRSPAGAFGARAE